jgi:hypothetical protein
VPSSLGTRTSKKNNRTTDPSAECPILQVCENEKSHTIHLLLSCEISTGFVVVTVESVLSNVVKVVMTCWWKGIKIPHFYPEDGSITLFLTLVPIDPTTVTAAEASEKAAVALF